MVLVALGGVFGSLLRWQIMEFLPSLALATFIVNQGGVLLAGFIAYRTFATVGQKLFWITGFAGGFTTMSLLAFIIQGSSALSGIFYGIASLVASWLLLFLIKPKVAQ